MPRENEPENENMEPKEHRPHPPRPEEIEKDGCICGKNCLCRHKHMGAKLVAALLIFLAGFGSAMVCKCMSHRSDCPYHHAMKGKHMPMNLADGAGNTIIINTDGTCSMKHQRPMPQKMKKQPPQMIPMQQMPMQNMATINSDEEDEE